MNKLSLILLLISPFNSFGSPIVGDYTEKFCDGTGRTFVSTETITQVDQAGNKIVVDHTDRFWPSGEIIGSSKRDQRLDEYLTLENKIKNIKNFCKSDAPAGSKIQRISTRAGEFTTCFIGDDTAGKYFADVPLFIAKSDGLYFSCEISKFLKSNP